jgi:hypothetical protein
MIDARSGCMLRTSRVPVGPIALVPDKQLGRIYVLAYGPTIEGAPVGRSCVAALDPAISAVFLQHGPALLAELAECDAWETVVAAEPSPRRTMSDARLDDVARAFADMVDLKLPFTRGHSSGVAGLAEAASRTLQRPENEVTSVRRAALFHDLGRVGIPNGVWKKRGPLSASEWEQATVTGIIISRFANGKWQEDYINWDTFGMLRQMGVIPSAQAAGV